MSRIKILIKTHPFTCASYNPFESLHIEKGSTHILVMIDAFSRWVELFPSKTSGASEAVGCIFQHFGRFRTPDVIQTDQGPAFRNELFSELSTVQGCRRSNIPSPQSTRRRRTVSSSVLIKKSCFLTHACTTSGPYFVYILEEIVCTYMF